MASIIKALSLLSVLTSVTHASPHALGAHSKHARAEPEIFGATEVLSTVTPEQGYLVALEDGKSFDQSFLDAIAGAVGVNATLVKDLTGGLIFNGVSIRVDAHDISVDVVTKIEALPGVVSVAKNEPVVFPEVKITSTAPAVRRDGTDRHANLLRRADATAPPFSSNDQIMAQIDLLRAKGFTGKGVKVANMERIADASHPALNISFTRDYRLSGDKESDAQCMSHSTATIGLIGALPGKSPSGYQGYAPGVTLGNYILTGCTGKGLLVDPVVEALEDAIKDGVNIVSVSLSWGDSNWKFLEKTQLLEKAAARGILIILANSGDNGLWRGSSSCAAAGVLCVSSVENTHTPRWQKEIAQYTITNGTTGDLRVRVENIGTGWAGVNLPLWSNLAPNAAGWGNWGGSGCVDLPAELPDLSKHIVLIRRALCNEDDMIDRIERAGGKYVIIGEIDNAPGQINPPWANIKRPHPNITALGTVSGIRAVDLIKVLREGKELMLNMSDMALRLHEEPKIYGGVKGGGRVEGTAWGPTFEGSMVADIAAPGQDIPILQPLSLGGWSAASGTSLATPIVASIAALVAEALGTTDPAILAAVLSSTAKPLPRKAGGGFEGLDSVARQGAGMIQADRAASVPVIVSVPNFEFNDTLRRTKKTFTITNLRTQPLTYELSNIAAATVYSFESGNTPFPVGDGNIIREKQSIQNAATLSFSTGTRITVPAKGKVTLEVSAADPTGIDATRIPIFSGWVLLSASDGSNLTVPYLGFTGDIDRVPKVYEIAVAKTSYVLPTEEVIITIRHGMDSRETKLLIVDALSGKQVGPEILGPYTRSASGFAMGWRGETNGFKWPAGQYKIRARSLRAFGMLRSTDEADYLYTDSAPFSFSRA